MSTNKDINAIRDNLDALSARLDHLSESHSDHVANNRRDVSAARRVADLSLGKVGSVTTKLAVVVDKLEKVPDKLAAVHDRVAVVERRIDQVVTQTIGAIREKTDEAYNLAHETHERAFDAAKEVATQSLRVSGQAAAQASSAETKADAIATVVNAMVNAVAKLTAHTFPTPTGPIVKDGVEVAQLASGNERREPVTKEGDQS